MPDLQPPTICYLSNIYFEDGAVRLLPDLLTQLKIKRPLIVTDSGLVSTGLVEQLPLEAPIVFDGVQPNPGESDATAGVDCYRKHNCDGVIAFGGGSPIDCAKAIALLVSHEPPLLQYAFANGGLPKITANQPPLIAIPTTAGTGSEVGRAALITFNNGTKLGLLSPHLIPTAVICDPNLTLGLPPMLTAATGMDAITHCAETFCSPKFNPIAQAIALDGLSRCITNIEIVVNNGTDIDARREMMMGALQGGMTFQKGLGVVHSLSHPLGALTQIKLHHGTLNAIFLPHVIRFNLESCPDQMSKIAGAIGAKSPAALPDFFTELTDRIGLPTRLSQMGLEQSDLDPLTQQAFNDHCSATNPRPVTLEDCQQLYQDAL